MPSGAMYQTEVPRYMIWTCRRCPNTWREKLQTPEDPKKSGLPDAHAETFCDECLNKMRARPAVTRTGSALVSTVAMLAGIAGLVAFWAIRQEPPVAMAQVPLIAQQLPPLVPNVPKFVTIPPQAGQNFVVPIRVIDGDTVDVGLLVIVRVRLNGIDAPERSKGEVAKQATDALTKMLPLGDFFVLDSHGIDSFGRVIGDLYRWQTGQLLGKSVSQQLLDAGLVDVYRP